MIAPLQVNNLVHEVPGLVGHYEWLLQWAQAAWPETQVGWGIRLCEFCLLANTVGDTRLCCR